MSEYHGTWAWHELASPDPEAAAGFYQQLFGWTTRGQDMGGETGVYTLFQRPGSSEDYGGVVRIQGPQWEGIPPHWMVYIAVDDVDASCAKAAEEGGEVKVPAFDIPGVGRMAVIADPHGAVFSVITPSTPAQS